MILAASDDPGTYFYPQAQPQPQATSLIDNIIQKKTEIESVPLRQQVVKLQQALKKAKARTRFLLTLAAEKQPGSPTRVKQAVINKMEAEMPAVIMFSNENPMLHDTEEDSDESQE